MKVSQKIASRLAGLVLWPFLREVQGTEHFPSEGPCILVANHLSVMDGVVLSAVMNNRVRHAHFISYKYLFHKPFIGAILRLNEGIELDSSSRQTTEQALAECRRLLADGRVVGLFPEAHISPFEKMRRARPGAAILALETGAPVFPVGLSGTQYVFPPRKGRPGVRWKAVSVRFGRPLDLSAYAEPYRRAGRKESLDILKGVSTIIMRAVTALSGQEYRHGAEAAARLEELGRTGDAR